MQLVMNGKVISSPSLFCEHFSPTELLIRREDAAHFMVNIMGPCSSENYFNAVVFLINVYEPAEAELTAENYKNYPDGFDALEKRADRIFEKARQEQLKNDKTTFFIRESKLQEYRDRASDKEKKYLEKQFNNRRTKDILEEIYGLVCSTALTDIIEKNQLFSLLASAYLIADKTLKECPLSPEAAHAAFKGIMPPRIIKADEHKELPSIPELNKAVDDSAAETEEKAPDVPSVPVEDSIFTVFAESENRVKGRNVAYKLKLRSSFTLEAGETVEPRKIIAEPSIEGVPIPVKLHVYDSEGKNKLDEIEISSEEYIFANYVGDELVYVHPTKAETDSCRVERKGYFITLTDKKTNKEKSVACDDCIVGVVPEQQNCGYIGIRTGGAFFSGYSNVRGFDTTYKGDDIVQVICTDQIYMLHKSGMVFKNMTLDLSSSVLYSDLRRYLEERQKHDYEQ